MLPLSTSSVARAVIVLAALAGAASPAAAETSFVVSLQFSPRERSSLLLHAMVAEATAIWAPYGVQFAWSTSGDANAAARAHGSFDVVIQRRRERAYSKSGQAVLGITRLQDLSIDHAPVIIDRDGVEETLAWLTTDRVLILAGHSTLRSTDVGRALGRVLAHEIGHVLLAQPMHQPQGLMRAAYVPADLAALRRDSFTLSPLEIERLQARLGALSAAIERRARLTNDTR